MKTAFVLGLLIAFTGCGRKKSVPTTADVLIDTALAGDVARCRQLIAGGLDVNMKAPNKWGWTALHAATFQGQEEMVSFLLTNGANPALTDQNGDTALHLSVLAQNRSNRSNIVVLLVHAGGNPFVENRSGISPISALSALNETESNRLYSAMTIQQRE